MLVCDKCKWENPDYAAFCTNCGTPIGQAKATPDKDWRFKERNPSGGTAEEAVESTALARGEAGSNDDSLNEPSAPPNPEGDHPVDADEATPPEPQGVSIRAARTLVDLTVPDFRAMVDVVRSPDSQDVEEDESPTPDSEVGADADLSEDAPPETLPLESSSSQRDESPDASESLEESVSSDDVASDESKHPSDSVPHDEEESAAENDAMASIEDSSEVGGPNTEASAQEVPVAPQLSTENARGEPEGPDLTSAGESEDSSSHRITEGKSEAEAQEPALLKAPADLVKAPVETPKAPRDLGSLDVVLESADGDESVDGLLLSSTDMKPVDIAAVAHRRPAEPPPTTVSRIRENELVIRCLSGHVAGVRSVDPSALTIGRSEGDLVVQKDEFLSPKHARLDCIQGDVQISDLGSVNGVWVRIRGERTLGLGHEFMVGRQVFLVGTVNDAEAKSASPMPGGTRRLGAAWRPSELCISRLSSSRRVISRFALPGDGLRIGRSVGDVVIGDDTSLSGVHAQLTPIGSDRIQIRDLSTGNGCWVRINGPETLQEGDTFMTGLTFWRLGRALSG